MVAQRNGDEKTEYFNKNIFTYNGNFTLGNLFIPWGVLCGTLAMQAGLTPFQGQLTSLLIFAGAAQLSGIALLGAGGSWSALINSTLMIGCRHFLYFATFRNEIIKLSLIKRLFFAFVLTDEMFVGYILDRREVK